MKSSRGIALLSTADVYNVLDEDSNADDDVRCVTCGLRDPMGFTWNNIAWIECELCAAWSVCSDMVSGEALFICTECMSEFV